VNPRRKKHICSKNTITRNISSKNYPSSQHASTSHVLCFGGLDIVLHGYVDLDMAGDKYSRRSTTGYVLTIGGTKLS
jgi:hypothetical protein